MNSQLCKFPPRRINTFGFPLTGTSIKQCCETVNRNIAQYVKIGYLNPGRATNLIKTSDDSSTAKHLATAGV